MDFSYKCQYKHIITIVALIFLVVTIFMSTQIESSVFIEQSTTPKWIVFSIGSSVLALIVSLLSLTDQFRLRLSLIEIVISVFLVGLVAYVICRSNCPYDYIKLLAGGLMCMMFCYIQNKMSLDTIMAYSFILCAVTACIQAIVQLINGENVCGNYDSNVGLAITLELGAISIVYNLRCVNALNRYIRVFYYILLISFIIIILYSHCRVAILSLGFGSLILLKKVRFIVFGVLLSLILCLTIFSQDKVSSTRGRWFILTTTVSLLDSPKKVAQGLGENGFTGNYMKEQARRLSSECDDVKQLADNIVHPLNEFLLMLVKYGIFPVMLCIAMSILILRAPKVNIYSKAILISILTFALFSYPFRYPISWIAMSYVLSSVCALSYFELKRCAVIKALKSLVIITCSIIAMTSTLLICNYLLAWKNACNTAMIGRIDNATVQYESLKNNLKSFEFLYNYSSFLYNSGRFDKALQVLDDSKMADYETILLKGRIHEALNNHKVALQNFALASDMCPNRFIPLYEIYKVHKKMKNYAESDSMAKRIIDKQVKIPSETIDYILTKVQEEY